MQSRFLGLTAIVCLAGVTLLAKDEVSMDALMEAGHWKRVRSIATAHIASNPNDAAAHAWLAKARIAFADYEGSVNEAERAVAIEPNNPAFQGQLAEACAMAADVSNPVKAYSYVRRMRKATAAALAANPNHVDTLLVDMMFTFKAPSLAGGDKKKAFQIADRIQSVAPAWGYLAHARLLQDSGDDPTTERMLKGAVQADPSFYRAHISLARFYCCTARTPRYDLAEKAARNAMELDPSQSGAYEVLATAYASRQRWNELDEALAHADRAAPDDRAAYYTAAHALIETGQDFRRAERYLQHYLAQPPNGRQPTHAQARWLMASLFEKEGRKSDAVRELLAAVRLEPTFEPAKKDLKRLQRS